LVVLAIALLVFGPKRLPELGAGLGKSIRGFREEMGNGGHAFTQEAVVSRDAETPPTVEPVMAASAGVDTGG
jgi:sec-independent protein translocase protein TatA